MYAGFHYTTTHAFRVSEISKAHLTNTCLHTKKGPPVTEGLFPCCKIACLFDLHRFALLAPKENGANYNRCTPPMQVKNIIRYYFLWMG